jgi:hypothetical protein
MMLPPRPLHDLAVATRAELLAAGWTDGEIRRQLARGTLKRVRHGSYIDASLWSELDERDRHRATALAVSRRAGCDHAWSHVTALAHLGMPLWGLGLDTVHLTRFDGRCGRRGGVAQHKGTTNVGDLTMRDGQLLTSPTRTALDVASSHDMERAVVAVGSLLHAGETTREELLLGIETMNQWPDSLLLRRVLRLADPRPESVAEHRFVYWCSHFGLPAPVPQLPVTVDGRTYRLDFAWPELRVWAEVDGRGKYDRWLQPGQSANDVVFHEKRREDLIREVTGWICIRITWADLADPVRLERRLRRALRQLAG